MILEHAILDVITGREADFERAMQLATPLISASPGFLGLEIWRNSGTKNKYLLLVRWAKIEDHSEGFRKSDRYLQWKKLLHGFYDPFPVVEYFGDVVINLSESNSS
jgi:heme-degrading monooxygenase HmoA